MDRLRPTLGLLLAGGALVAGAIAATATPGAIAIPIAAVLTAAGYSARRHGWVGRTGGGTIGVVGGGALVVGGGTLFLTQDPTAVARIASGVVVALGIGCTAIGVAEWRETPVAVLAAQTRVLFFGAAVGLGALVVAGALGNLPESILSSGGIEPPAWATFGLAQAGIALGFVLSTAGFVVLTGRPWGFIDLRWPTRRDLTYVVAGTVAILVAAMAVQFVLVQFGVEFVEHRVEERARQGDTAILAVAFVFAFVANGLGEELLYRNVVQKYFAERFAPAVAITLASIVFALVHFPAYGDPDPIATLGTVTVVFVLSIVLGVAYHRTDNIVVPALIHGGYNAVLWVLVFVSL